MKTVTLTIPNMTSGHCQMTVSTIVKSLGGSVNSIAPGKVTIGVSERTSTDLIMDAINDAGYRIENHTNN